MSTAPCRTCEATRDTADLTCPFCGIADRPGAARLRDHRLASAASIDTRCEVCGSKTGANDALCATCRRAEENTVTNTESSGVLAAPFVLLITAGIVLLLKVFPAMNTSYEFGGDNWVSPRVMNPWIFIVGVVVAIWGVSVLVIMQNDQDRWTGHPKTRGKIRNQSWFQIVAGVILVVVAVTT
jgi:hypothetical protein